MPGSDDTTSLLNAHSVWLPCMGPFTMSDKAITLPEIIATPLFRDCGHTISEVPDNPSFMLLPEFRSHRARRTIKQNWQSWLLPAPRGFQHAITALWWKSTGHDKISMKMCQNDLGAVVRFNVLVSLKNKHYQLVFLVSTQHNKA